MDMARHRLRKWTRYLGRVNVQETMPACSGRRTSSTTSARRGMSRLTRFVTRPIDEFVFKEDEEEKHRRHILPMSPRPSTAIPQVPPDSCPPGHGHYRDPEPPLPHPHEARGGGVSGGSRVSGRPPAPRAHAGPCTEPLGLAGGQVRSHWRARWGRACP